MMISKIINGNKNRKKFFFQDILCIREDEIGDICYSLHVFKSLKNQFPGAKLTMLCKPFVVPLLQNDSSIDLVTSEWKTLTGNYDLIVDLRGSSKSNRYAMMHRPKIRLDRGTIRFRNMRKGNHPHELETNMQVIEPIIEAVNRVLKPKLDIGINETERAVKFLAENHIQSFAVLHTGARRMLRKWPLKNFATLAMNLKAKKKLDIIFCGDNSDGEDIEQLKKMISFEIFSVAGNFNLPEFAALVSKADLFIGNESGPLHIASVVGTPSLGLFGPGEPIVFYPKGKKTAYIHPVLECNPCDQIHCVHPENPCIQRITMIEVNEKIDWLLTKTDKKSEST